MIFSDNVPIAEEAALKREARDAGLLVMGPDCGTAIIGGVPLGFANVVPRGDIGIIGASGTGIQEVSCLIARAGRGISHAIGTGGRDLKAEVGAITTLMAIDALDADAATQACRADLQAAGRIGRQAGARPRRAEVPSLSRSAFSARKHSRCRRMRAPPRRSTPRPRCVVGRSGRRPVKPPLRLLERGKLVRGLFAGGTLCGEAQIVFRQAGLAVASNVPVPGARCDAGAQGGHVMIDLGDDEFTRGRPHPMIEPAVRDAPLAEALADPAVGVILLDVVLGYGGHPDPAGHLAAFLAGRERRPLIVASVTGTDGDPQPRDAQVRKLAEAGVIVADSNADAAEAAIAALGASEPCAPHE